VTPARCRKVKGRGDEPRTEAPVNGGRNYNGPKVTVSFAALVKSGYMLEHPSISQYLRAEGDNLWSADNQQERLVRIGWILGFVDGEGCFSIGFVRQSGGTTRRGYTTGYQVAHEFAVTQGARSLACLHELHEFFGVGQVLVNHRSDNHTEHLYRYVVRRRIDLLDTIIPFFQQYPLRSSKRADFEKFVTCVRIVSEGRHLTRDGLIEIAQITETMNRRKSRTELIGILRDHTPDTRDIE
jgi:LAGLIDADG endonuclease